MWRHNGGAWGIASLPTTASNVNRWADVANDFHSNEAPPWQARETKMISWASYDPYPRLGLFNDGINTFIKKSVYTYVNKICEVHDIAWLSLFNKEYITETFQIDATIPRKYKPCITQAIRAKVIPCTALHNHALLSPLIKNPYRNGRFHFSRAQLAALWKQMAKRWQWVLFWITSRQLMFPGNIYKQNCQFRQSKFTTGMDFLQEFFNATKLTLL